MPVILENGFKNPVACETFRCISFTPEAFTVDWRVDPQGYVPFEHIHLNQDEIFFVRSGELKIRINGVEYIVPEGMRIRVPKGMRHIAFNNKSELLQCTVELKPGLDNYKFFQCFGGLTMDNEYSSNGTVNIPKMLYFTKKMKAQCITRPAKIPAPFFYFSINLFYLIGSFLGWKKYYLKYTGEN